jgi:hypothetical protein
MRPQVLAFVLLFLAFSCNTTEPPVNGNAALHFQAVGASCTEVWIEVKLAPGASPRTLTLQRDSLTILTTALTGTDTLIVDEGLLPNRQYTYTLTRPNGLFTDRLTAAITTMDTTSHDWVFDQPVLLGEGSSSVLYDCQIVSADPDSLLVLAVGEIYYSDSSQSFLPFSVASWNGQTWQLKRLYYNGTNIITAIRGIWVAGPNDIWLAAGSVFHWDGVSSQAQLSFSRLALPDPNATIEKLWGSPDVGLYGVGNAGTIVHRDLNGTWRRVESGTGLPIMGIHGARKENGGYEILCVSADPNIPGHSQVLAIENTAVREMATNPLWEPWGIWFVPGRRYLHAGDGLWEAHVPNGPWVRNGQLPAQFKTSIDGQGFNDIVVGGAFWLLVHWNGVNWQSYFPRTSGSFTSVDIKDDLIIAVGGTGNRALVIQGRR